MTDAISIQRTTAIIGSLLFPANPLSRDDEGVAVWKRQK